MENVIRFCSYNLRGFNQGKFIINDLLAGCDVLLVQEHWLTPENLFQLELDEDFMVFSSSAMDSASKRNIMLGRPFGGVAIYIRK
jgi:hypothetical protein